MDTIRRRRRAGPPKMSVFDMAANQIINAKQAAEYLGYKVSYLYNLVWRGALQPYKCGKKAQGSLRFIKGDLDDYLGRC